MVEKLRMLLDNKWEKYDEKAMKKKKTIVVSGLLLFIWVMFFLLSYSTIENVTESAFCASGVLVLVVVIIAVKLRQMDQKKDGWYFSGLQDERLKREDILALIREFLTSKGYAFKEEETHRTVTLWITYFTLPTTDFKMRLWFTKLGGVPVVEIGIGPETPLNKTTIENLRNDISKEFVKRYGSGSFVKMPEKKEKIPSDFQKNENERKDSPYKVK